MQAQPNYHATVYRNEMEIILFRIIRILNPSHLRIAPNSGAIYARVRIVAAIKLN